MGGGFDHTAASSDFEYTVETLPLFLISFHVTSTPVSGTCPVSTPSAEDRTPERSSLIVTVHQGMYGGDRDFKGTGRRGTHVQARH